jgi:hypothetical protein
VNWDGPINKAAGSTGLGCVARDHERIFLGAKSIFKQIVVDPMVVEVTAALKAVQFCNEFYLFIYFYFFVSALKVMLWQLLRRLIRVRSFLVVLANLLVR